MTHTHAISKLRVVHIVPPSFGYTFSGISYILELIQNWKDTEIKLELFGSDFLTSRSDQQAGGGKSGIWKKPIRNSIARRLVWTIKLLGMLILKHKEYDLIHFHIQWWGTLVSPFIVHYFKKKVIYQMSLFGSDNPTAVESEALGHLKLKLLKQFDGLVGMSPALIDDCRNHGFSSELFVAPAFDTINPATILDDEQRLSIRQRLNILPQDQVILFVGSIIERKGVDLVIDAYMRLVETNKNLWLLMVGPKAYHENPRLDEAFVNLQMNRLIDAGLQDRVIWTGLITDRSALAEYYQAADLFFFPTRREGQGNVILEAMAYSLPVVTTALAGITDMMVTSGHNGYLVEQNNLDGFIQAIQTLLDDKELRGQMGESGRRFVLKNFGFDQYCENLSAFYRRVAQRF